MAGEDRAQVVAHEAAQALTDSDGKKVVLQTCSVSRHSTYWEERTLLTIKTSRASSGMRSGSLREGSSATSAIRPASPWTQICLFLATVVCARASTHAIAGSRSAGSCTRFRRRDKMSSTTTE